MKAPVTGDAGPKRTKRGAEEVPKRSEVMTYTYHKSEFHFTFLLTKAPRNPKLKLASLLEGAPMSDVLKMPNVERLECQLNLNYNWGYEKTRQDLRDLYKKAQRSQWNPDDTLP